MENQRREFADHSQWMNLQKRKHQASSQSAPENAADMRKRIRIRYSKEEEEMLVKEVIKRWDDLFGPKSRKLPRGARTNLWNEIAAKLEGTSQGVRAGEDLRKKWIYLKQCLLEKVEAQRLSTYPYFEANRPTDLTAVEQQLLSLLSQTAVQPALPDAWGGDNSSRSPADTDVFSSSTSSETEFPSSSSCSGIPLESDPVRSLNAPSLERVNLSNLLVNDDAQVWDPDLSAHARNAGLCDDNDDEPTVNINNLILPTPRRLVRPGTDNVTPVMAAVVNRQRQCLSVQKEAVKALKRLAADVRKFVDYVTMSSGCEDGLTSGMPVNEHFSHLLGNLSSGTPSNPPPTDSPQLTKHSEPKTSTSNLLSSPCPEPQDLSLLNEDVLLERFRLDRGTIVHVCDLLRPHVANQQMAVESTVCAALSFYATGSFQSTIGDQFGVAQPAMRNAVQIVTDALVNISDQFIQLPVPAAHLQVQQDFFRLAGFPGIVGALGCTHIAIRPPQLLPNLYLNRKGFHSMNLQITVTPDCRITSAVARFPGSYSCTHVLQHSSLEAFCSRGNLRKGHLIAHAGYPLHHWLLPPLQNPQADAEVRYNKALLRSHGVVVKTVALLKARFPCLDRSVVPLQFSPKKSAHIILACCILHNIAISRQVRLPGSTNPGSKDPKTVAHEDFNCEGDEEVLSDSEEIVALRITEGQQKQAFTIQQYFS
ncbi:hypothetical protein AGOR_G00049320 [Albula goreensis]|uniref:Putative nuclease HARBI1 n=1 Tax=Albula goreensis TaxID=1534307 RepID=A0A8T3DWR0_9TELE|nr:hypothetical protein AGOR_G00049320 [Albula goreensis]